MVVRVSNLIQIWQEPGRKCYSHSWKQNVKLSCGRDIGQLLAGPNNAAKVSLTFKSPGESKEPYDTSLINSWRIHDQSYIFHVKSPKRSDKNLLEASFYIEQFRKLAWLAIWGNGMAQVVELRRMCPRVEGPILQNQIFCKLEQMDKLKIAALFWSHRSPYLKNHKTKSRIRSYEEIISVNLHYAEN